MNIDQGELIEVEGWVCRVRRPAGPGPHPVMLLVHGWTGDENVMWIFTPRLPKDALLIAPRGLHPAPGGGYGWHPDRGRWPVVEDFRPVIDRLLGLLTPANFPEADLKRVHLVGFSQGAALIYTLALLHPERVLSVAGLAGFLPEDAAELLPAGQAAGLAAPKPQAGAQPEGNLPAAGSKESSELLRGRPVFITHGTRDETVPVERARQAAGLFEQAGAEVSYCEDQVGHKLSASCFRGLEAFYKDLAV